MPREEYDCLAIVDGDNVIRGIQRQVFGVIDIEKFTTFIQARLLTESARIPLLIWCQTLMSSDSQFSERNRVLEHCGWRISAISGAVGKDGCWRGMPDSFIAQEARKALIEYRIARMLLASGDGYFIPLINQAKEHNVHTIVLSISNDLHPQLRAIANEVIELEQHLGDVCAQKRISSANIWAKEAISLAISGQPLVGKKKRRRRRHR